MLNDDDDDDDGGSDDEDDNVVNDYTVATCSQYPSVTELSVRSLEDLFLKDTSALQVQSEVVPNQTLTALGSPFSPASPHLAWAGARGATFVRRLPGCFVWIPAAAVPGLAGP